MGIGYDVEGKGVDNLKPYLYLVSTDDNGANPVVKKVYGMSIAKMMNDNANIEYAEGRCSALPARSTPSVTAAFSMCSTLTSRIPLRVLQAAV